MRRYVAPLLLFAGGVVWLVTGTLVVPAVIHDAYRGESIDALNSIIQGQAELPVEAYLRRWSLFFWLTMLVLMAAGSLSLVNAVRLQNAWRRYWFSPSAVGYLAVCRIVCVATQLVLLVTVSVYNRERLLELSQLPTSWYKPLPVLKIFLWPLGTDMRPSLEAVTAVYWMTLAAGILALVGFRSNSSLVIFAAGCTFLQAFAYSFGDLHHPEALMIITLWSLALSPAGRALSVDDILSRGAALPRIRAQARKKSRFASWPLLLSQYLIAIIYLDAAVRKLWIAGVDWTNGYTLQFYLLSDGLRRGNELGVWLGQQHWLAWILSWISIVFEATFFIVLVIPELVWVYIPLGIAFHIGNDVVGVASFYQFVAIYAVFLPRLVRTRARIAGFLRWILPIGSPVHPAEAPLFQPREKV